MYIAGLELSFPQIHHTQGMEPLIALSTMSHIAIVIKGTCSVASLAESPSGAGPLKPAQDVPTRARIATAVDCLALFSTPLAYLAGVLSNGMEQPGWFESMRYPNDVDAFLGISGKSMVQTAACLASLGTAGLYNSTMRHLGAQWADIGVRQNPKVIQTGLYKYVRHPLYALTLSQGLLFSIMFWSYAPLITTGVSAIALAVKMPVEERLIEQDKVAGPAYMDYKGNVPSQIIPFIW